MTEVAICDDESIFAEKIKEIILEYSKKRNIKYDVTTYTCPVDLLRDFREKTKDFKIIFLDILLKESNGVEVAKKLRELDKNIEIVFCSSSKEFLLDGYSVYPLHYLIKPVLKNKLVDVLTKFEEKHLSRQSCVLSTRKGQAVFSTNEVIYIETLNRKLYIYTERQTYESSSSLKEVKKQFDERQFIRCHKSFLINLEKVKTLSKNEAVMKNNAKIPVGRTFCTDCFKALIEFL